jgi:hypothetical protein
MRKLIGIAALLVSLTAGGALLSACYTGECVVYSSGAAGQGRTILYGGSCTEAYLISAQIPGSSVGPWPANGPEVPTGPYNH